jgi:hypothetical protein
MLPVGDTVLGCSPDLEVAVFSMAEYEGLRGGDLLAAELEHAVAQ